MCRIAFIVSLVIISAHTVLGLSGSGTEAEPWRIKSLADFDEFAWDENYWDDWTRLETDVNLAGLTYTTAVIAPDTNSSAFLFQGTAFSGVFDGNDHNIINLTIDDGGAGNDYLGLFGYIDDGEVRNLGLEGGSIVGTKSYVGSMIGRNDGSISNCYSTGFVSGASVVGGLVGRNNDGSVWNCFWDTDTQTHGVTESIGPYEGGTVTNVVGLTTAEMQIRSTFTDAGWDFEEIWDIGEKQTYPYLRQYLSADLNHDGRVDMLDFAILAGQWLEGVGG